jgi:hypothetical protein
MTEIGLYHNVRRDGRTSTGLVADGDDLVEWPTPPLPEDLASLNPRLDWYLELVVPTASDVGSDDEARTWYEANRTGLKSAIETVAATLVAGMDGNAVKWTCPVPWPEGAGRFTVATGSTTAARRIGDYLKEFAQAMLADPIPVAVHEPQATPCGHAGFVGAGR